MPSSATHWMCEVSTPPPEIEAFNEAAHLVVHERSHHAGAQAKALGKATRHVIFAAAFPRAELSRGADAALAGVQAEHDLAERDRVVPTVRGRP